MGYLLAFGFGLMFWALLAYLFPTAALIGSIVIALVLILGALSSMEDRE